MGTRFTAGIDGLVADQFFGGSGGAVVQPVSRENQPSKISTANLDTRQLCGMAPQTQAITIINWPCVPALASGSELVTHAMDSRQMPAGIVRCVSIIGKKMLIRAQKLLHFLRRHDTLVS
jgi:hypothetical protein